jgi:hypothetical protein
MADGDMLRAHVLKRLRRCEIRKDRRRITADAEPWQSSRQTVPQALDFERTLCIAVQQERDRDLADKRQARVGCVCGVEAHPFERRNGFAEALGIGAIITHDPGERFRCIHGVIPTVLTRFADVPSTALQAHGETRTNRRCCHNRNEMPAPKRVVDQITHALDETPLIGVELHGVCTGFRHAQQ